ncbi:MAG: MFS transporter [Anaerolineae bacterium]|nr:MFS transporter [Anaerolineae bacterium]
MNKTASRSYTHKQIIQAWCMYDWANSAFATTIMAAVLPVYYSQVAGATLPSEARATSYWSLGLSLSLLVVAVLSPILGTISDVMRGKKRFLAFFVSIGVLMTGLLILVDTGDWLLASVLFVLARIGFTGANVFYDALLPHIATEEEQDEVSARGYAMGYLGGGLLLAVNIAMIQFLPGTWGARLSFLSVGLWWAVFSIPIFRRVAEPPAATAPGEAAGGVIATSFKRLWNTFKDIRQYRELFKYLIAYLIYNDGIGTIIGVSAIYGAELGFGSIELILALLLVQFVGIPYSLIFGRLPNAEERRRPFFLAFVVFNLVALPLAGVVGMRVLPSDVTGAPPEPFTDTMTAVGEGTYLSDEPVFDLLGDWDLVTVAAKEAGTAEDVIYATSDDVTARFAFPFNGQKLQLIYSVGPDRGIWAIEIDGEPLIDDNTNAPLTINAYNRTVRYGVRQTLLAPEAGEHVLSIVNTGNNDAASSGALMTLAQVTVMPPIRMSNLLLILGIILGLQVIGLGFAFLAGKPLFSTLAEKMDTRRGIILSLCIYAVIAVWGFILNSVIEFWMLAWMVAVVQGGSQALSRSLYASMAPASKSGEFFGLFGIMEKFSAILGPLMFAAAAAAFNSSRPAVLSLILLFIVGIFMLTRVDVVEGRRVAKTEDAKAGLR